MTKPTDKSPIETLKAIMEKLRDPDGGCPWDIEQTFHTIAPHTIEEAYEVADAIESGDMMHLRDELGDLLLQVIFHAQIAKDQGSFDFDDVTRAINEKMIRRHPHVFGDATVASSEAQTQAWETQKAEERSAKAALNGQTAASVLSDVTVGLPALTRAVKLQKRAARVGFDWQHWRDVIDKITEELGEVGAVIDSPETPNQKDELEDEIGDLLFATVNLARKLDIDPEQALRHGNAKFTRRFQRIEELLNEQGKTPDQSNLAEMDRLWDQAKAEEKAEMPAHPKPGDKNAG